METMKKNLRLWRVGKKSAGSPPAPGYVRLRDGGDETTGIARGGGCCCKGKVPVLVGEGDEAMERLHIPTKMIKHPRIVALLEMSADEFGYQQQGTIKIPCDVQHLRRTIEMISKEMGKR